jgi:hypothetical protein
MSEANDKLDRLGREAEVLESRLLRDVDTLARRKPVQAVREVEAHPDVVRAIAIGAAAGIAAFAIAWMIARALR